MDSLYVFLKSVENTPESAQNISLLIALLAVFFGPIMSYFTTKLTIRSQLKSIEQQTSTQISIAQHTVKSQVLSGNRQQWINTLRDNISEFIALVGMISANILQKDIAREKFERLIQVRVKISLLLNMSEQDHQQLNSLLNHATSQITDQIAKNRITTDFQKTRDDIVTLSQKILKREWERVKNVE